MLRITRGAFLAVLLTASTVSAQEPTPQTITPSVGPASGGQEVILKGDFGMWPYGVIFGSVGVPAERVDEHTLRAITPPHPAGSVSVVIFEGDVGISTDLEYTFFGDPGEALERVLLPIFTPPVLGNFGSEFRTDFRAINLDHAIYKHTFGFTPDSPRLCCAHEDGGFTFGQGQEIRPGDLIPTGNPGRFVYLRKDDVDDIAMQLRVYDVSRDATNFGTEIPVVHEDEMFVDEAIVLLGVPSDPLFRNTLRIYGTSPATVTLRMEFADVMQERNVTLQAGANAYEPAYAVISDLPANAGTMRLTILPPGVPPITPAEPPPALWAFVSVTNNDTQHITVISPQR